MAARVKLKMVDVQKSLLHAMFAIVDCNVEMMVASR
jgi:hypothetical protein